MAGSFKLARGDVVLVPFPFTDLTAQKVRPAVIVSADPQVPDVIVAFISSVLTNRSPRSAEVELLRSDPEFASSGLKVDSLIRLDKLATLSRSIVSRRLGTAGTTTSSNIGTMLRRALDLS